MKKIFIILFTFVFVLPAFALSSAEVFSFVVFGDPHNNDDVFVPLLKKISQEPDLAFAVNCGDLVAPNNEADFRHYLKTISAVNLKIYHVPGNHDLVGRGEVYFKKYIGDLYYSFDYGNSHFIVLNNAFARYFNRAQFKWLKNDLANNHQRHTFVFLHRPTFDPSEIYADYMMSGREVVEELMGLFEKYKVDYVFAGHLHGYAKTTRNNVTYVITGGGGAPLYLPHDLGGFYHYIKINVAGDRVSDKIIRLYD